ncbi:MAG: PEP-CTERM system TPR-repeat protein PrsT [Gammaproteobacteria bacterium]|nr:PEP-CTERM system TPR-repeat protein PrsT [Gammaproteobacteria bacterium]
MALWTGWRVDRRLMGKKRQGRVMDYYSGKRLAGKRSLNIIVMAFSMALLASCSSEPTDSKAFVEQALQYYQSGKIEPAIIAYKNALIAAPDDVAARSALGEIYLAMGDAAGAEKELGRALRLKPGDETLLVNQGQALLLQGKYKKILRDFAPTEAMSDRSQAELYVIQAKAHFSLGELEAGSELADKALQKNPDAVSAHVLQAKKVLMSGDVELAEVSLDKALSVNDKDPEALLFRADLAMKRGDFPAAKSTYERVVDSAFKEVMTLYKHQALNGLVRANLAEKNYSGALKHVEQLLASNDRNPNSLYLRSMIAYEQKEYALAEDYLEKLLSISSDHKPSLLLMGAVKYVLGSFEQANRYLSQYMAIDPDNLFPRKLLGATRLMLQQPEEAYEILSKGIANNADDQQLITLISTAAIRSGNYQLGKEYIDKILPSSPESSSLRSELAMAYLSGGNADDVIALLAGGNNSDLNEQMALVAAYLQKGNFPKVIDLSRKAIKEHPAQPNGYIAIAKVYMTKGDFELARNELQQALDNVEPSVLLFSSMAELEYRDGKLEKARDYFEKAHSLEQGNERTAIGLAQIYVQLGRESDALKLMEKLIRLDDKAVMPRMLLARHYLRNGKPETAESYLNQILDKAEDSTSAKVLISQLYIQSGRLNDAVSVLNQLVKEDDAVASLLMHAQVHLQLGNEAVALNSLERANRIDPRNEQVIVMMAVAEATSGNFRMAHKYADKLIAAHPDRAGGYILKGDFYAAQGEFQQALSAYNSAKKIGLSQVLVVKLYQVKLKLNRQDAVAELELWVDKNPSDVNVKKMIASDYLNRGKYEKTLHLYNDILLNSPDDYLVYNNLAWVHLELGDIERGKTAATKAYELKGDDANVMDTYGWLLFKSGDDVKAESLLSQAYALMPDSSDIKYHYAAVLAKANKHSEAKRLLTEALEKKGSFMARSDAEKLMKRLN